MDKNYGLQIVPIVMGDNWVFGSELSIGNLKGQEVLQLDGQWTPYLPPGEEQYNFTYETNSCVSFALTNANEILNSRLYGRKDNYSDRFLAVASETTPTGNDPHKVCETLRLKGVCNEDEYPFTPDLTSREKYFTPIPQNIFGRALRFFAEFDFNHEYVNSSSATLKEALKYSPLPAAVYAWVRDENGLYYMPAGRIQNHYVVIVGYVEGKYWIIYDSYDVEEKGQFIKHVRWDTPFIMVKRIARSRRVVNETPWQQFLKFLKLSFPISL